MKFLENKIPPPLVGLIIGACMWYLSTLATAATAYSETVRVSLVIFFISVGIFFDLAGVISFRVAKTTVNPLKPNKTSALVTSGIYQVSRNPMYVGFVSFLFAWASFLGTAWGVILIGLYIAYIHHFQIKPEERALNHIFKDEFTDYKKHVRPWL